MGHSKDMNLAKKISSQIELNAEYDEFALNECLVKIPNASNKNANDKVFDFEIDEEIEAMRKRKLNQRKRAKIASKLREKYEKNENSENVIVNTAKNKKITKKKKKKKSFRGAQGGSGDSKFYDIGDSKNNKQSGGVKKVIPQHIKKKRKR